jgi:hypothetical protein
LSAWKKNLVGPGLFSDRFVADKLWDKMSARELCHLLESRFRTINVDNNIPDGSVVIDAEEISAGNRTSFANKSLEAVMWDLLAYSRSVGIFNW